MKKLVIKADGVVIAERRGSEEALKAEAKRLRAEYKRMNTFSVYKVSIVKA